SPQRRARDRLDHTRHRGHLPRRRAWSGRGARRRPADRDRPGPDAVHRHRRDQAACRRRHVPGVVVGVRAADRRALSATPSSRDALGLYGPDSEAWRLNREAMLLLGAGPRALLLQLAPPPGAAGVDEHSDFRTDPWARLQATLRSYLTIVYGTSTAARAEIRRLDALHRST